MKRLPMGFLTDMPPEQDIRRIIQEELSSLLKSDRYVFERLIQIADGRNIQVGLTTGTKIGTSGGSGGQKIGFFGHIPVTQQAAITPPTGGGSAGVDTPARTAINSIITELQNLGLTL